MRPNILMPASLALQMATETIDKTHQYEEAITVLANTIEKAVEQGKKFVNVDCLRVDFSEKVKQMWMNELVKEGYEVHIIDSRTPHVNISWETPNKPIPR